MKELSEIIQHPNFFKLLEANDGFAGFLSFPGRTRKERTRNKIAIVCSYGGGWEHVSVSLKNRCPTWEEMCTVKDIFWGDEECVVQYHPPKSEYVNTHPYCLHLWKKIGSEFETPPKEFI